MYNRQSRSFYKLFPVKRKLVFWLIEHNRFFEFVLLWDVSGAATINCWVSMLFRVLSRSFTIYTTWSEPHSINTSACISFMISRTVPTSWIIFFTICNVMVEFLTFVATFYVEPVKNPAAERTNVYSVTIVFNELTNCRTNTNSSLILSWIFLVSFHI